MTNILQQFEKRLPQLEADLCRLQGKLGEQEAPWWEKIAGRQKEPCAKSFIKAAFPSSN